MLRAELSNSASNQGKLQPLHKQMLLKTEMLLPGSSPEHRHQFPQGQVGARGLQWEGGCLLSSFTKCLQGSYTKAPNLVGDKPLTGPQLQGQKSPKQPPALRSCAPHMGPVPVTCRIRVRLEPPHGGTRRWRAEHCRNWGAPLLPQPPAILDLRGQLHHPDQEPGAGITALKRAGPQGTGAGMQVLLLRPPLTL